MTNHEICGTIYVGKRRFPLPFPTQMCSNSRGGCANTTPYSMYMSIALSKFSSSSACDEQLPPLSLETDFNNSLGTGKETSMLLLPKWWCGISRLPHPNISTDRNKALCRDSVAERVGCPSRNISQMGGEERGKNPMECEGYVGPHGIAPHILD